MLPIDASHDPALLSWVESANDPASDFPVQNLPFGRFRVAPSTGWRIGVAIGDQVLDLRGAGLIRFATMDRLLAFTQRQRQLLRARLCAGLQRGSAQQGAWQEHLYPQDQVEMGLPCDIPDFTDFYAGIHHAHAVGKIFRPDNPLLPNYRWLPVGYHARASSIQASGVDFHRPWGQVMAAQAQAPELQPTQALDFELELGIVIGRANLPGHAIALSDAEDHVFGLTLLNDWSARDIQAWEYQPLGPFLSKSFASTVSPWIVTLEALAPFRKPLVRAADAPPGLAYLSNDNNQLRGAFDVSLQVQLQTAAMHAAAMAPHTICRSNFSEAAYWTPAQLVTHHTVNGCNLRCGDLLGTGTLSGPLPSQAGSLLERTQAGKAPLTLPNGELRTFLLDADRVIIMGQCHAQGRRSIGFGACAATVLPART